MKKFLLLALVLCLAKFCLAQEVIGQPEQYCFIFTVQGAGAYSGVFDFAIE